MARTTSPVALAVGDIVDGKYRIERVIGQGGMGVVAAARHLGLDQLVAIKCMRSAALAFEEAAQRFVREARVVARLRSENIARVRDVGRLPDGSLYMVMEYLEGIDLAVLLKRHGPLSVHDAVDLLLQACAGVAEAHECDIVHRDIKPANLFLTRRPTGAPLLKVLDFGISKYRPRNADPTVETSTHDTIGSPPFMSPEQAKSSKEVDHRSDIWSLGVTLYVLLTGQKPFTGDSAIEIFFQVLNEAHPPLREQAPWVPAELCAVIDRCLAKNPDERYSRISHLATELTPFASDRARALVAASQIRISVAMPAQIPLASERADGAPVIVAGPEPVDMAGLFREIQRAHTDDPEPTPAVSSSGRTDTAAFAATAHASSEAGDLLDVDAPTEVTSDPQPIPTELVIGSPRAGAVRPDSAPVSPHRATPNRNQWMLVAVALVLLMVAGGWWIFGRGSAGSSDERKDTHSATGAAVPVAAPTAAQAVPAPDSPATPPSDAAETADPPAGVVDAVNPPADVADAVDPPHEEVKTARKRAKKRRRSRARRNGDRKRKNKRKPAGDESAFDTFDD